MEKDNQIEILDFTLDDVQDSNNFQINNSGINNEDELLKLFIGKNVNKIMNKNFNFSCFFFGSFYLFYRKMFLYGLLLLFSKILILALIGSFNNLYFIDLIIILIISIICGLFFNKVYLNYIKTKIKKMKLNNHSDDEIKKICIKNGGTSANNVLIGLLLGILIFVLINVIMSIIGFSSLFNKFFSKQKSYNGAIETNTFVIIKNEFSINIPDNFEEDSLFGGKDYSYEYKGSGNLSNCSMSFQGINGYTSSEKLMKQMRDFYKEDNPSDISYNEINGISWYGFNYKNNFGETYYYATVKNDVVYLFNYELKNNDDTSCLVYKDEILSSINKI